MAKIDEVAAGIYRIHTAIPPTVAPGGLIEELAKAVA